MRTFLYTPRDASASSPIVLLYDANKQSLEQLENCRISQKQLRIKYIFGVLGHDRFLINLRKKETVQNADAITKEALGAFCKAIPWRTHEGEKFVPGARRKAAKTKHADETKYRAESAFPPSCAFSTIERYAAQVFGDSNGEARLLGPAAGQTTEFSYTRMAGLALLKQSSTSEQHIQVPLVSPIKRETLEGAQIPEATAAADKEVDVGLDRDHKPSSLWSAAIDISANRSCVTTTRTCCLTTAARQNLSRPWSTKNNNSNYDPIEIGQEQSAAEPMVVATSSSAICGTKRLREDGIASPHLGLASRSSPVPLFIECCLTLPAASSQGGQQKGVPAGVAFPRSDGVHLAKNARATERTTGLMTQRYAIQQRPVPECESTRQPDVLQKVISQQQHQYQKAPQQRPFHMKGWGIGEQLQRDGNVCSTYPIDLNVTEVLSNSWSSGVERWPRPSLSTPLEIGDSSTSRNVGTSGPPQSRTSTGSQSSSNPSLVERQVLSTNPTVLANAERKMTLSGPARGSGVTTNSTADSTDNFKVRPSP